MGESMIIRRSSSSGGSGKQLITELITENTQWKVPEGVKNNQFSIRIFGGGGGGHGGNGNSRVYGFGGGGGGYMNNDILTLTPGDIIPITIGAGGNAYIENIINASSGGITSFGSYLSANGGECGKIIAGEYSYYYIYGGNGGSGGGGRYGGIGFQFGGGGGTDSGGDGGMWGGGGGGETTDGGNGGTYGGGGGGGCNGGNGGTYGGGGGGGWGNTRHGGDGGTYGGGGGCGSLLDMTNGMYFRFNFGRGGNGGQYGGGGGGGMSANIRKNTIGNPGIGGIKNGANGIKSYKLNKGNYNSIDIEVGVAYTGNGTNTLGWTNVFNDGNRYFNGDGKGNYDDITIDASNYEKFSIGCCGGAGYGGRGGLSTVKYTNYYWAMHNFVICGGGGGGGYGGNGGCVDGVIGTIKDNNTFYSYGGGGGGYGGDGGNGCIYKSQAALASYVLSGGGGGGFSSKGGDNAGGGGGYYGNGGSICGGGGGYYGHGGSGEINETYGYGVGGPGGGGGYYGNGGNGGKYISGSGGYAAGGGGGYGRGGSYKKNPLFGGGGCGMYEASSNGADGICIIQYYI